MVGFRQFDTSKSLLEEEMQLKKKIPNPDRMGTKSTEDFPE